MDVSIIIPLLDEEKTIEKLFELIDKSLSDNKLSYETIFIDDGSKDDSWEVIVNLAKKDKRVKALRFNKNHGKSIALSAGFEKAIGKVIVTLDADLQDNPKEIPAFVKKINDGYDMVSGWKKKRYDPLFSKKIPSLVFNRFARFVSGIKLHDFNCGIKAFSQEVLKNLIIHEGMHRFIPVLVKNAGFSKIGELVVDHSPRKFGKSKFGSGRFLRGLLDLLTIWFLTKFVKKPMYFFGTLGLISFFFGFVTAFIIGAVKIYRLLNNIPTKLVTENPWFYISLTIMIIGTQLFLAGFLGEIITKKSIKRPDYIVKSKLNIE